MREIREWSPNSSELKLFRLLLDHNGGATFLPALHSLKWTVTQLDLDLSNAGGVITALLSPRMKSLTWKIDYGVAGEQVAEVLTQVAIKSPLLFSLTAPIVQGDTFLLPLLSSFRNLRELDVVDYYHALTPARFQAFTVLSRLQSLRCRVDGFAGCRDTFRAPSLRRLELHDGTLATATGFFPCLDAPLLDDIDIRMKGLSVNSSDGYHPDGLRDLLAEIAGMGFARNLRAFNLSTYVGRRAQGAALDRAIPSVLDVVRPLLASPRLQFVDIFYMWRPTYLTDDNILALSQAWTQLERLDIVIRNRPHLSPTLNCLSHLARHCPKLVKVLLFAEIVIQEPLCVPELPPSSPHPLRELRFTERPGGWDVDAVPPASIARFLYTLFPSLVLEECNPFDGPDFNDKAHEWQTVRQAYCVLQQGRWAFILLELAPN